MYKETKTVGIVPVEIIQCQLFQMSEMVKKGLSLAVKSFIHKEPTFAFSVIDSDKVINSYEIDIDNATYKFLAFDNSDMLSFKLILSIQKLNAILERIGDHAVNIAESSITLNSYNIAWDNRNIVEMTELTEEILQNAVKTFMQQDYNLAHNLLDKDEKIDNLNISITEEIKTQVMTGQLSFDKAMEIIRISKNLERIADLASNIIEETILCFEGKNVKHHQDNPQN